MVGKTTRPQVSQRDPGYIIKIEAQAGQKGLITNFYTADTMLTDEYEFLLPRNTSIEITSMDIKNKTVGAKIVNN